MWYYDYSPMGWLGWGGWIIMLLWWALVIAGIVLFARWLISLSGSRHKSALDVLKERYAKGEIEKKEFEEKKKDIA